MFPCSAVLAGLIWRLSGLASALSSRWKWMTTALACLSATGQQCRECGALGGGAHGDART